MDDWELTLASLRSAFLDRVPRLADDASAALDRLVDDPASVVALSALRLAFHNLAGSGGTYGFTAIAAAASDGESLCRPHLDASTCPSSAELTQLRQIIARIDAETTEARSGNALGPSRADHVAAPAPPSPT